MKDVRVLNKYRYGFKEIREEEYLDEKSGSWKRRRVEENWLPDYIVWAVIMVAVPIVVIYLFTWPFRADAERREALQAERYEQQIAHEQQIAQCISLEELGAQEGTTIEYHSCNVYYNPHVVAVVSCDVYSGKTIGYIQIEGIQSQHNYSTFTCYATPGHGMPDAFSCILRVYGDGKLLYTSNALTNTTGEFELNICEESSKIHSFSPQSAHFLCTTFYR